MMRSLFTHLAAMLTLVALLFPAGLEAADGGGIPADKNLDSQAASDLLKSNPAIVPLDVRTPGEYQAGRLAKCTHIDFYARDFKERLAKLDRDKPYLVYCAMGGRSASVYAMLQELGFTDLYHLRTGFHGWRKAGQPVDKDQ